ncbi:MAG: nucleotidyltransferase domain-containing protein [Planctomycetaceae bacterium]
MIPHKDTLLKQVEAHPYPLLFATISGAHLYGFPSADSDFDLRGAHILPLESVVGLEQKDESRDKTDFYNGLEVDLVTHDVAKFFALMLKKNGYVLEQVHSPLVVHTTPEHEELCEIAKACVTKHHSHHYLGFAANQWKLFEKEQPRRVKPLLYTFRVLLTGIHLMRTGEIQANIITLNESHKLSYIEELVEKKTSGPEKGTLDDSDTAFYTNEYRRLVQALETEHDKSDLPELPTGKAALNDLLVRIRMQTPT